jgi:hypothetical protein
MISKIQNLLEQAERQADNTAPQESSISCASRAFSTVSEAENFLDNLKSKLLHVKKWSEKSGLSSYELFDENGSLSHRKQAIIGDFIRIALHGSGKYDWVKILDIYDSPNEIVLTVKPSFNPTAEETDRNVTSHFFTSEATNNFCVERKENTINFYVIGLSEKTNTGETESFVETVRNFATANIGSYFGIQKSEWKKFCENFLKIKDKQD